MSFDDAHWHLLFNHWPILGAMLTILVLAYGLLRRLPAVVTLSYWLLLLMAAATVATMQAGQAAQDTLKQLGLLDKTLAHKHIQAGRQAALVMYATALLALLGLAWPWARQRRFWPALVLAATVLTSGLMAYAGRLGGLVRHTELRANPHERPDGQPVTVKPP
ncbi:hypothetical protein [uncultured Hymenobacter sp.]|uniref:hypothetical protein n=1 Tax=uncultured Hymenobacter sp. TaxID=170016 RepID=UPI0035CB49D4